MKLRKWLLVEDGITILNSYYYKITAIKNLKNYRGVGYGELSIVLKRDFQIS